ncbi:MAG: YggT family protein [Chloroflexi bacterium]|nr:YggT family protein [Chloroflexota bacterium]
MSLGSGASFLVNFVGTLFFILQFAIIIRALMSWFNPSPDNPVVRIVYELTEPILAPLRRIVPRIGMIDITPIVALLLLQVIESVLRQAL